MTCAPIDLSLTLNQDDILRWSDAAPSFQTALQSSVCCSRFESKKAKRYGEKKIKSWSNPVSHPATYVRVLWVDRRFIKENRNKNGWLNYVLLPIIFFTSGTATSNTSSISFQTSAWYIFSSLVGAKAREEKRSRLCSVQLIHDMLVGRIQGGIQGAIEPRHNLIPGSFITVLCNSV